MMADTGGGGSAGDGSTVTAKASTLPIDAAGLTPDKQRAIMNEMSEALKRALKKHVLGGDEDGDADGHASPDGLVGHGNPLQNAAERGNAKQVKRCLADAPDNVDVQNKDGRTPLILACAHDISDAEVSIKPNSSKYIETVKLLADKTENINHQDKKGRTALWEAVDSNESTIVQIMCGDGEGLKKKEDDVKPSSEFLKKMQDNEINPNFHATNPNEDDQDDDPFWTAWQGALAKRGDSSLEMLSALCTAQARGEAAARKKVWDEIEKLAPAKPSRKSSVCGRKSSSVSRMSTSAAPLTDEQLERMEAFRREKEAAYGNEWTRMTDSDALDGHRRVWSKRGSPVHVAVVGDSCEELKILLKPYPCNEDGDEFVTLFDPRAVDEYGQTALMLACKRGNLDMIVPLMEYCQHYREECGVQVDVNAKNHYGMTALMMAIKGGHNEVVEQLMESKNLARPVVVLKNT